MVKKNGLFFVGLLVCLCWAAPAMADTKVFGPFKLDLPAGWSSEYNAEAGNAALVLENPGKTASLTFALILLEGETFAEFMEFMASEPLPGAGKPLKQSDGTWLITYDAQAFGMPGREIYKPIDSHSALCQTMLGADPAMEDILKSFSLNPKASF